ncbi:MAG: hypothetical protein ACKOB4_14560 [Acidobacteriota bacterium]
MGERIHLQGVTSSSRHLIIEAAREAITDAGGWIVDFHLFSNLALSLIFELDPVRLIQLLDRFAALDIRLSDESLESAQRVAAAPPREDVRVLFNLTFQEGDGDLRIPVPAIPG